MCAHANVSSVQGTPSLGSDPPIHTCRLMGVCYAIGSDRTRYALRFCKACNRNIRNICEGPGVGVRLSPGAGAAPAPRLGAGERVSNRPAGLACLLASDVESRQRANGCPRRCAITHQAPFACVRRKQAPVGELSAVKGNGEGLLGLLASRAGSARKAVCGVAQSRQAPLAMRREGLGVRRKQAQCRKQAARERLPAQSPRRCAITHQALSLACVESKRRWVSSAQ